MFEAIVCHGNGIHGVFDFDKIKIGDDLTSICNINIDVLKINNYDFIVSIGETRTGRNPEDHNKITSSRR